MSFAENCDLKRCDPSPLLAGVRGLIFDCDGVLFDTREVNRQFYNHILNGLGLPDMNDEDEEYVFMHTVDASIARIIPSDLIGQAREIQMSMNYLDFMDRMIPAPGIHELLEALEKHGILMAVNTNRKNSMEMVLDRFGMARFFDPVMTAAKVARPKPDPEGVLHILDVWNFKPNEVAFLGDSAVDQETTVRSGVPFWAYRNLHLQANLHIDSFHELRQWVERVFAR